MRLLVRPLLLVSVCFGIGALTACSQEASDAPSQVTADALPSVAPAPTVGEDDSAIGQSQPTEPPLELTVADVDAYVKGLQKENELARAAVDQKQSAESDEARLEIMMNALPQELKLDAVEASGLNRNRYFQVRDSIGNVLSGIEMKSIMIDQAAPVDTTGMSEDMAQLVRDNTALVQKAYGDPFKDVSTEVAQVIQRRHDELRQLLNDNLELVMSVAQE